MVDSQRIEFEAAALIKLFHIRPHCVPKVYLMDSKSKSSEAEYTVFACFSFCCMLKVQYVTFA